VLCVVCCVYVCVGFVDLCCEAEKGHLEVLGGALLFRSLGRVPFPCL